MYHPTDRITHTTAFVTPVVEHWLEQEIAYDQMHGVGIQIPAIILLPFINTGKTTIHFIGSAHTPYLPYWLRQPVAICVIIGNSNPYCTAC